MTHKWDIASPYLQRIFNESLLRRTAKELAEDAGVSYGYARRVVTGRLIPSQTALRKLCAAAGLDFPTVWKQLRHEQDENLPDLPIEGEGVVTMEISLPLSKKMAEGVDRLSPEQKAARNQSFHQVLNSTFDQLPFEGQLELLFQARKLADHYGAKQQS
jgi:hypothetical protein